jgi:hypothetical protein
VGAASATSTVVAGVPVAVAVATAGCGSSPAMAAKLDRPAAIKINAGVAGRPAPRGRGFLF